MTNPQPKYWFPAKRYGWGWGPPATWQGWAVLLTWLAALLILSPLLALRSPVLFALFLAAMIAAILTICLIKGEPPRWRWGDRR